MLKAARLMELMKRGMNSEEQHLQMMQNVPVQRLYQWLFCILQALVNLKTGICVWTTKGTLLSRDDFSSSKVLADAESKRNRTNFMLSFGPHTDPPGDPCTPQL